MQKLINWLTHNKFQKSNFTKENIKSDLYAGLIVGLILIPQSLAYAQLAGLPPVYGLYASILPVVIAVLFGSSNFLSTGPVAVLSILTASTIAPLAAPGSSAYITYAVMLALVSGILQTTLGFLKAGWLVNFLSHPVVYGFTNAAAIMIALTQLGNLFGVSVPAQSHYYLTIWETIKIIPSQSNLQTIILGASSLIFILGLKKINPKIPAALIAIVIGTLISWWMGLDVKTIGLIESPIPNLTIPEFHLHYLYDLFFGVIIISIIGFTETIAVAQSIATKAKQKINADHELIGQGLANISSALSGGYPVAGSISRTALNYANGAKTWLASVFSALVILLAVLFLFKFLQFTPQVLLAVVIITAVTSLINFKKFRTIFRISLHDGIAAVITFVGTLIFAPDMETGILFGLAFSIGYFIYRNSHPQIVFLSRYKNGALYDANVWHLKQCKNIVVVRLDGPLFFANANYFQNRLITYLSKHPKTNYIILVAGAISQIDATGAEILNELHSNFNSVGKKLFIANIKFPAEKMLKKIELWKQIGENCFFTNTQIAVREVIKMANLDKNHTDKKDCPLENYHHKHQQKPKLLNSELLGKIANKYIIKPLDKI